MSGIHWVVGALFAVLAARSAIAQPVPAQPLSEPIPISPSPHAQPAKAQPDPAQQAPAATAEVAPDAPNAVSASAVVPARLHRFAVRVRNPNALLEIRTLSDAVVARCVEGCWLELPTGDYRGYEMTANREELRSVDFAVREPGGIEIEQPNSAAATTGLVLAISGMVLLPTGFMLSVSSICDGVCPDNDTRRARAYVGVGAMLAGAALTPIGWVLFARNRQSKVHRFRLEQFGVGVVPSRDQTTLDVVGRF